MQLGMVGLGRMGANMVCGLMRGGHSYSAFVEDSGEGRWTIMAAVERAVPAQVLSGALYARFRSRARHTFADKMLSAMRKGFGGHVEPGVKVS